MRVDTHRPHGILSSDPPGEQVIRAVTERLPSGRVFVSGT
jgi:hypothetical protein